MSTLRDNYALLTQESHAITTTAFATTTGFSAGSSDMNVNGSLTPLDFFISAPPGFAYRVNYIAVYLTDMGNMDELGYGSLAPGVVTNGLQLFFQTGNEPQQLIEAPFVTNEDFVRRSSGGFIETIFAGAERGLTYRDLVADYSNGFLIVGDDADKFGVKVQDDLTTLRSHSFLIKGTFLPWSK